MLHVTLLLPPLLPKLWAVLYRQTSCCYSHWQQWKGWSDLFETTCLAVFFFFLFLSRPSLLLPTLYSVRFQKYLQFLLRGNEELVMVGGGQELIFLSFLSISLPLFLFTICFVCLGWIRTETVECLTCAGWWEPLRRVQGLNVLI